MRGKLSLLITAIILVTHTLLAPIHTFASKVSQSESKSDIAKVNTKDEQNIPLYKSENYETSTVLYELKHGDEVIILKENDSLAYVEVAIDLKNQEHTVLEGYIEKKYLDLENKEEGNDFSNVDTTDETVTTNKKENFSEDAEDSKLKSLYDEDDDLSENSSHNGIVQDDKNNNLNSGPFSLTKDSFEYKGAAAKEFTHIRSEPSTKSIAKKVVTIGEILEYNPYNEHWYIVKLGDDTGFIHKKHINPLVPVEKKELKGIAKRDTTYIRSKPSTKADPAKTVPIGSILEYNTFSEHWHEVKINNNTIGYIHVKHVENTSTNPKTITGIARKSPTHIRSRASTKGKTIKKIPAGSIIEYKELSEFWFEISIDNKVGYIHKFHVENALVDQEEHVGIALRSPTNVRQLPSTKANIIGTFDQEEILTLRTFSTYWYEVDIVQDGKTYTGYIHKNHLKNIEGKKIKGLTRKRKTPIYIKPSKNSMTVKTLPNGEIIEYTLIDKEWYQVNDTVNGEKIAGFVHRDDVENIIINQTTSWGMALNETTNIRTKPTVDSEVLTSFPANTIIKYKSFSTLWHEVTVEVNGKSQTGYIHDYHIDNINDKVFRGVAKKKTTYIRTKPSTTSTPLTTVPIGTVINYKQFNDYWYEATINVNGKERKGYIHKNHIEETEFNQKHLEGKALRNPTNIRVRPSTEARVLTTFKQGADIGYKTFSAHWYEVTVLVNGKRQTGYVHKNHVGHQAFITTTNRYNFTTQAFLKAQMSVNPLTDVRNVYVHQNALTKSKNGRWVVSGTNWNVRNKPTTSGSKVVGKLDERYTNEPITVHGKSGNFYHISGWILADESDTLSYLDPTNFKEGTNTFFQFLVLSDYSGTNAVELNEKILAGKGILDGRGQAFISAAKMHHVNELYLISHAILETGHGTSALATGGIYNGKTVYNMYGIGAASNCQPSPYECGLARAYKEGWFTPEDAIIGGAKFIAEDYVHAGQDTLYKMRWNPDGYVNFGKPVHQYATDIGWAVKQTSNLLKYYNLLDSFVAKFEVPIFEK